LQYKIFKEATCNYCIALQASGHSNNDLKITLFKLF